MNIKPLLTLSFVTALGLAGTSAAMASPSNGVLVRQDGIYLRCDQCGTVQGVQHNVTQGRNSGTAGAIIGAVAGGVLGNQIGKGSGRTPKPWSTASGFPHRCGTPTCFTRRSCPSPAPRSRGLLIRHCSTGDQFPACADRVLHGADPGRTTRRIARDLPTVLNADHVVGAGG